MSNATAVLVSGLPAGATKEAVEVFFSRVGPVREAVVAETETAVTATVAFDNAADAAEAVLLSGVEFSEGVPITVAASKAAVDGEAAPRADRDLNKIVLRKINPETTQEQVRAHFADCGEIVDIYLSEGRTPAHAFVGFATPEAVEAALAKNGTEMGGVPLEIEKKRRIIHDHRVLFSCLPADITEEVLRSFLAEAECTVAAMHVNAAKGIAYVNFASAEDVARAVAKSGAEVGGATVTIEAKPHGGCTGCGDTGHRASRCPQRREGGRGGDRPSGEDRRRRGGDAGGACGERRFERRGGDRAANIVCHACGKMGHFVRNCPTGGRGGRGGRGGGLRRRRDDSRDLSRDRYRRRRDDSRDGRRRRSRSRSDSYDRSRRYRRRSSSTPPRRRRSPRSRSPRDRR